MSSPEFPPVRITPGRVAFAIFATLTLIATLAYLQIAFDGADLKTAVRLVEEAKVAGQPLGKRLNAVIPLERRRCTAVTRNEFQGHLEVTCSDISDAQHVLRWNINVLDGMVQPANQAAVDLGKGN